MTALKSLKYLIKVVVLIFFKEYLRKPNNDDIARLLAIDEKPRFSIMLGNIDYMHQKWKNYPTTWYGMYSSHIYKPNVVLEAMNSYDLWIQHVFGLPRSHNNINVLNK